MIPKKETEIKEVSVIDICISRSKQIIQMKKAAITLQAAKTEVLKCSKRFPTEDKIIELATEIDNTITEYSMSIAKLLKPLLIPHGINLELTFWFSSDDIRSGYVLFRKPNNMGATHVLFLKDHEDTFDATKVKAGDILLYKHVNHFLEKIDVTTALKKAQTKSKKDEQHT